MKSSNDDRMAKPTKKAPAKSASKPGTKAKNGAKAPVKAAKAAKKPAPQPAKPKKAAGPEAKKGLFDKVLTKLGVKATGDTKAAAAKPDSTSAAAPKSAPAKSAGKKGKAAKAPKGRRDEEEFLPEPEDGSGEDLPDLEEFDETEEATAEDEADSETDSDSDDAEVAASPSADDEIILTDAEGRRYCKVRECDQAAMVDGYCRYHYLLLWKRIQVRRKILVDGKLERYVEELTARYPDKFLEMIRRDLKTEKDFLSAIAELEIDESANENEFEDEAQTYIDEVRGVSETGMSEEEEF